MKSIAVERMREQMHGRDGREAANAMSAELEHKLQESAQHVVLVQQNVAQQISMFEKQSLTMKYDIDTSSRWAT